MAISEQDGIAPPPAVSRNDIMRRAVCNVATNLPPTVEETASSAYGLLAVTLASS